MVLAEEETVHNNKLNHDEVKVLVKNLYEPNLKHPHYNYEIEVGSYVAWKLEELDVIE